MRLKDRIPGSGYLAIILSAALLPLGRHLRPIGEGLEFRRVGADHQANNLKRTLFAQAMLAIIDGLRAGFLIAAGIQEPVL